MLWAATHGEQQQDGTMIMSHGQWPWPTNEQQQQRQQAAAAAAAAERQQQQGSSSSGSGSSKQERGLCLKRSKGSPLPTNATN